MRTRASIKNSALGTISMVFKILIGFIAQKIFVLILNKEYLGANGLFSNIITLLSLAELGIGQAIIFNLYKPIANNDRETVKSLMLLYKKAYNIIAVAVLFIGLCMIPFLGFFIGETTLDLNFTIVYLLFLLQSVASYICTYKRSILYAYQEKYIIDVADTIYVFGSNAVQLVLLCFTKNYYLYLICKAICVLIENLAINNIANKKYTFLKDKDVRKLDKNIEKDIFERIKAQIFHKVGGIVVNGTDNIVISKFFGLATVGIYSNYYMIIYSVTSIITQIISSIVPSVGNLLVEEDKGKSFDVYKKVRFLNFWISTFSGISIFVIIQSFITLWMGEDFLLQMLVIIMLVLSFYFNTMRVTNDTFITAGGICVETKYVPVVESILNIGLSIALIKPFGLAGVFIGTIVSGMALWCYTYPKFCYKNILGGTYKNYIKENVTFFMLFVVIATFTYAISTLIGIQNLWIDIVVKALLCLIIPNLILYVIYRKSEEFEYFKNLFKFIIEKKKVL